MLEAFIDEQQWMQWLCAAFPECFHHSEVARFSNNTAENKSCANQLYLATCAVAWDTEVLVKWINCDLSRFRALSEDLWNQLLLTLKYFCVCHLDVMWPAWNQNALKPGSLGMRQFWYWLLACWYDTYKEAKPHTQLHPVHLSGNHTVYCTVATGGVSHLRTITLLN